MILRATFVLTFVLFLLALFCVAFSVKATMQTVQNLRRQNAMARSGDVCTVDQWMTIPYIAHTYHVPEAYLYSQLHLSSAGGLHHMKLQVLATRNNQPVSYLISEAQQGILAYRTLHPASTITASTLTFTKNGQWGRHKQ